MNMTDGELLRRYVRDRSETAFAELVRRHINLIYSAALRLVNGDAHLAEDATQMVFADLARKAARLTQHTSLTGWLCTSTRFVAANFRRAEQRRSAREQEAHTMNAIFNTTESEPDWSQIRPLLDEAMHTLDAEDREAVLMRHFENRSYAEIGASFGLTENAARMRVERALGKLHGALAKHGVTSTAMALAGLLTANAVGAAPAHLAAKVMSAALTGAATAGGFSVLVSQIPTASKIKLALGTLAAALVGVLTIVVTSRHASAGASEKAVAVTAPTNSSSTVSNTNPPTTSASVIAGVPMKVTNGLVLHLGIVTADTGQPIPMVPIDFWGRADKTFTGRKTLMSDRFGNCDVVYPTNITELELTTRKDNFADTRLLWHPPVGEIIPTNYVLRLDRPAPIGGLVVDADGKPVAGAHVGWNHQDDPAALKVPQNHEFGWIEVTTDENGRWQINRIAEEMISRIYGSARDTNYMDTSLIFAGQDKTAEKQLREGTYVFKLGRAATINGIVTDADGTPVPEADILVGTVGNSARRNGRTQNDGTFSISGCPLKTELVTASATGYAATTVKVNAGENAEPVRLVLKPGKTLRLRVVDAIGNPIPKARIWYDCINSTSLSLDGIRPIPVQVEFIATTDRQGLVVLTNAPDCEMKFTASAAGFHNGGDIRIRPDNEEHLIKLSKALKVHGIVWDEATGERIPKFRIALGWPERNPIEGTTNAVWSTIGRFWLDFSGGTYSNTLEEAVMGGTENRGYILKFIADGYAPILTRVIGPDEGDVELNVTLRRGATAAVTVYNPDGRPATDADVGLVFPGAKLSLAHGGFSRQNVQTGGSLLHTDSKGTFVLQHDDALARVIAASSAGYAEATPGALSADPTMRMQPWGQLEVTCTTGGGPAAGREYLLELGGGSRDTVSFDFETGRVKTDEQERLSIPQMPPGHHNLIRLYSRTESGNVTSWIYGDKTPFEIRSGETTTLNLGASSYAVTAKLQWPAGMQRLAQWRVGATLHTIMPTIPQEARTNETARLAFMATDAFKAAQQNAHTYPATVNNDDTLSMDEVKPGEYRLSVFVDDSSGMNSPPLIAGAGSGIKIIAQGSMNVIVPSNPPSGNLDAGIIELKKPPTSAR